MVLLLICAFKYGSHEHCTIKLDPNINLYFKLSLSSESFKLFLLMTNNNFCEFILNKT